MKNDAKIIAAVAVGAVGIIIGAVVLILLQRPSAVENPEESVYSAEASQESAYESTRADSELTEAEAESASQQQEFGETLPAPTNAAEGERLAQMIIGEWKPESAYVTDSGEYADLAFIYGTGYQTYGGVLKFKKDNTFSINVGITTDGDRNNGKYFCFEEKIAVIYNNDSEADYIPEFDSDGNVISVAVPQGIYTVVFVRK